MQLITDEREVVAIYQAESHEVQDACERARGCSVTWRNDLCMVQDVDGGVIAIYWRGVRFEPAAASEREE